MRQMQENPTSARAVSEEVHRAVVDCYCRLQHVDQAIAEAGFTGGIPFDSILGVEMAAELEIRLGVVLPEERLMDSRVYSSIRAFAGMFEACVNSVEARAE